MFDKKNPIFKIALITGGIAVTASAITAGVVVGVNLNNNSQQDIESEFILNEEDKASIIYTDLSNEKTFILASAALLNKKFDFQAGEDSSLNYTIDFEHSIANDETGEITFKVNVKKNGFAKQVFYENTIDEFLPLNFSSTVTKIKSDFKSLDETGIINISEKNSNTSISLSDVKNAIPSEAVKILTNDNFDFKISDSSITEKLFFKNATENLSKDDLINLNFEIKNASETSTFNFTLIAQVASKSVVENKNILNKQKLYLEDTIFVNPINVNDLISNSSGSFIILKNNEVNPSKKLASQFNLSDFLINSNINQFNEETLNLDDLFEYSLFSIKSDDENKQNTLFVEIILSANKNLKESFAIKLNNFISIDEAVLNSQNEPTLININTDISKIFTPGILATGSQEEIDKIIIANFNTLYNLPKNNFNFTYTLDSINANYNNGSIDVTYTINGNNIPSSNLSKTYTKTIIGFLKNDKIDIEKFNLLNLNSVVNSQSSVFSSDLIRPLKDAFVIKEVSSSDISLKAQTSLEDLVINDISFNYNQLVKNLEEEAEAARNFLKILLKNNFNNAFLTENFVFDLFSPSFEITNIEINEFDIFEGTVTLEYDLEFNSNLLINSINTDLITKRNTIKISGFKKIPTIDENNLNIINDFFNDETNFSFGSLERNKLPSAYTTDNFSNIVLTPEAESQLIEEGSPIELLVTNVFPDNNLARISLAVEISIGNFTKTGIITLKGFINGNQESLNNSVGVNFKSNNNILPSKIKAIIDSNNGKILNINSELSTIVLGFSFKSQNLELGAYEINIDKESVIFDDALGELEFNYTITLNTFGNIISTEKSSGKIQKFLTNDQDNLNNTVINFLETPLGKASLDLQPSEIDKTKLKEIIKNVIIDSEIIDNTLYEFSNIKIEPNNTTGELKISSLDITYNRLTSTLNNNNQGYLINNLKSDAQNTIEKIFNNKPIPKPKTSVTDFTNLTNNDFEIEISNSSSNYDFEIVSVTSKGAPSADRAEYIVVVKIFQKDNINVFIQYSNDVILG